MRTKTKILFNRSSRKLQFNITTFNKKDLEDYQHESTIKMTLTHLWQKENIRTFVRIAVKRFRFGRLQAKALMQKDSIKQDCVFLKAFTKSLPAKNRTSSNEYFTQTYQHS